MTQGDRDERVQRGLGTAAGALHFFTFSKWKRIRAAVAVVLVTLTFAAATAASGSPFLIVATVLAAWGGIRLLHGLGVGRDLAAFASRETRTSVGVLTLSGLGLIALGFVLMWIGLEVVE